MVHGQTRKLGVTLTLVLVSGLVSGCGGNFASATVAEFEVDDESEFDLAQSSTLGSSPATTTSDTAIEGEPTTQLVTPGLPIPGPDQPSLGAANQARDDGFCEGFVSDARSVEIPFLPKPGYLSAYIDPAFGSRVTRVTDSLPGEVNKPAYSTMQAWNADESYLLLYRTGGANAGHKLLHGHSYDFLQDLDFTPADIEDVYWSHTDPDVLYYISKRSADFGKLMQFNVSTNQSTVLEDFGPYCGAGLPSGGNDVHMQSLNDDLFGFSCQKDDGHHIMFSYTPSIGVVQSASIGMGTDWSEWTAPVPTPSGKQFWYQGYVLANDLQQVVRQLDIANSSEHANVGMTHDGVDAYYQVGFNSSPDGCDGDLYNGVGHLIEHNLDTGGCRNIISQEKGYPYTTSGTHISAQAYLKPARVALSSIGRQDQLVHFTNNIQAPSLLSEVYVAQTDPANTKVCRLAHHRSYGKSAENGDYAAYFGEPHATISPTGTRVIFGSDWYDSGSVDSFVIELPDYVRL